MFGDSKSEERRRKCKDWNCFSVWHVMFSKSRPKASKMKMAGDGGGVKESWVWPLCHLTKKSKIHKSSDNLVTECTPSETKP